MFIPREKINMKTKASSTITKSRKIDNKVRSYYSSRGYSIFPSPKPLFDFFGFDTHHHRVWIHVFKDKETMDKVSEYKLPKGIVLEIVKYDEKQKGDVPLNRIVFPKT